MRTSVRGERVTLRPTSGDDLDLLAGWFADQTFAIWWGGTPKSREDVAKKYLNEGSERLAYVIEAQGVPVGFIQAWSHTAPDGGIDIILTPESCGKGLGVDAVIALANHVRTLGWRNITVDPKADNRRAIRAFEKAGFVRERSTGEFIVMSLRERSPF